MGDDDFSPREHDHLVEPMFGGLGVEGRAPEEQPDHETAAERPGPIARFLAWLRVRIARDPRPRAGR